MDKNGTVQSRSFSVDVDCVGRVIYGAVEYRVMADLMSANALY